MKQISFGEIAEFRNGLNFGKDSHGMGCLIIGIPDFRDRFYPDYSSLGEINPLGIIKEEDYLRKEDILFVRSNGNKDLVGRSLYIDKDIKAVYSGFCIRARLTSSVVDPLFCAYYTRSDRFKSSISSSGGTNIQNLNQGILANVKLPLFSIRSQKQIAKVLSDLDAKIEVNNKINKELEAMAKTLYDYWFVQFDFPDKNGKPYKSSGGKMVYNEELKREIPEGWEVKDLSEIENNIITGKTPSTIVEENFGGEIPFITIDDIRQNLYIYKADRTLSDLGAETQKNKYLYENDICVSCIGTIGEIGFVGKLSQSNQQINTISQPRDYNRYFLFQYLKNYFAFNIGAKKGAVLSNMNKSEFESIRVLNSTVEIKKHYHKIIGSSFNRISKNVKENQKLAELRDWLLPMLMNGQVSIGEAQDTAVGEAEERLSMVAEERGKYNKI